MSLANGRRYLAIPGPSVLPDRVLAAMQRPSPNIYAGELVDLVPGLWADLKRLAGTKGHLAAYIGNGHAGWEAVDTNLFSRGDRVLVLACGNFGHGWANALRALEVQVDLLDFGKRQAADPAQVEAALRADDTQQIKAVLMTQVDTATSIKSDVRAIRAAIDAAGHPALFGVDCIASLGCDDYRMDEWGVDVTLAASQKGLMTPAGMVFVWFSEKARLAGQGAGLRTPYWNWGPRANPAPGEFWEYWHGTAPTHHLFALRAALDMIFEEGLPQVHQRHARLARAVWTAVEVWGQGNPAIGLNVADPAARAGAVTSIRMGAPDATRLRAWVEAEAGLTLGVGLGMGTPDDPKADGWLRLAHMGHVNAHMSLGALGVIEAGLNALGIAHGVGAVEAAGKAAFG